MGRRPLGERALTNAEKKIRQRKRQIARLVAYETALQEITELKDMTDKTTLERMLNMAATAEKVLADHKEG